MDVDVSKYLDDEQMRQIAEDEYRECVREEIRRRGRLWLDVTLGNAAHVIVWQEVDEALDGGAERAIADAVTKVIDGLTECSVFRKKGDWQREDSVGQVMLEHAVADSRDLIDERVKEIVSGLDPSDVRYLVEDAVRDAVCNWMAGVDE